MDEWLNTNGRPYAPLPAVAAWQAGYASAGRELSEHLYHQGTDNSASYAAVEGIASMIERAATLIGTHTPSWLYRSGAADFNESGTAARIRVAVSRCMEKGFAEGARRSDRCIATLKGEGVTTLNGIARALNDREITTARGGAWTEATVRNLISRRLSA